MPVYINGHKVEGIPEPVGSVQGDLLYNNGTEWTRLPAGAAGQLLRTQGAGANPEWAEDFTTAPYTAPVVYAGDENVLLFDCSFNAITLYLPAAADHTDRIYYIKKTDTTVNDLTVLPDGAELINEDTSMVLSGGGRPCLYIISDGTSWHII